MENLVGTNIETSPLLAAFIVLERVRHANGRKKNKNIAVIPASYNNK